MKKAFVLLVALAVTMFAMASSAEAGKKTGGSIAIYGFDAPNAADTVSFGQLFSAKKSCVADRRYEATVSFQGKRTVIDTGRTSEEGAISAFATVSDFPHDRGDPFISIAKTKKCAKVIGPLFPPLRAGPTWRATSSEVILSGLFGAGNDAVVGGFIDSEKAKCTQARKIELKVGTRTTDSGTTTPTEGTFALHITVAEAEQPLALVVPGAKHCAASVLTFSGSG